MKFNLNRQQRSFSVKLLKMIDNENQEGIKKLFERKHTALYIEAIEELTIKEISTLLRLLSPEKASKLFENFEEDLQEKLTINLTKKFLKNIFEQYDADDIVKILDRFSKNEPKKKIISVLPKKLLKEFQTLTKFKYDEIGRHMRLNFITLKTNQTMKTALKHIKAKVNLDDKELDSVFFVTNNDKVEGFITLKEIFRRKDSERIKSAMVQPITIKQTDDVENAIELFREFELATLAVVDSSNNIKGVVTSEDILYSIEDEVTEDFQKYAGILESEDITTTYMQTSVWNIFKSRIGWLVILIFVASIAQIITENFTALWGIVETNNDSASRVPRWAIPAFVSALAVVSMLNDTAGNTGSQTTSTVLRALSTGDASQEDFKKVIFKEIKIAFLAGLTLSIFNFARMTIIDSFSGIENGVPRIMRETNIRLSINAVTSLSLFIVVIISKTFGALLPYVALKLKIDPAPFAGPVVTTLNDIFAVALHFTLTTLFFAPQLFGL